MAASLVMDCDAPGCSNTLVWRSEPAKGLRMSPSVARQYVLPKHGWASGSKGDFCRTHANQSKRRQKLPT